MGPVGRLDCGVSAAFCYNARMTPIDPFTLADWRRRVAELYALVRAASDPREAWWLWRNGRDDLFAHHPQSPLDTRQRATFTGLRYADYNPNLRLVGRLRRNVARETLALELPAEGRLSFTRIAGVDFELGATPLTLFLYWIEGYGGGLFLPFRDSSNGRGSYGGGRYLVDAIKGADPGVGGDTVVLDFNFSYNPSCAYNDRWVCPLALPENCLALPIPAGEWACA